MQDDSWIGRTTAHMAMVHFFDFLVMADDKTKCVGIRIKDTGEDIMADDPRMKLFIGDNFKTLDEACFYDFGKDMEACCEK